jgi:hypothetical protein
MIPLHPDLQAEVEFLARCQAEWKAIEAQLDKGYNLAHDILNNLNTILSTGQTNNKESK